MGLFVLRIMQTEFPQTNIMDRVSDWLGGFVPGCAHLPPRHPIKVSLVMGFLGLISGWLFCMSFWSFKNIVWRWGNSSFLPLMGMLAVSWLLVLTPLCLWKGRRLIAIALSFLPPILSFMYMVMWDSNFRLTWSRHEPYWTSFFYSAVLMAIPAAFHAVWVGVVIRRNLLAVLILTTCSCCLVGASVFQLINSLNWPGDWLGGIPIIAAVSTTYLITLDCCLGIALWDRMPSPKFGQERRQQQTVPRP